MTSALGPRTKDNNLLSRISFSSCFPFSSVSQCRSFMSGCTCVCPGDGGNPQEADLEHLVVSQIQPPSHPSLILTPGPCSQCPRKSEQCNPNLSSTLLWNHSCETSCEKAMSQPQRKWTQSKLLSYTAAPKPQGILYLSKNMSVWRSDLAQL